MKYYYTDPLAAAWMAKHHGMRFIAAGLEVWVRTLAQLNEITDEMPAGYQIEVHPDSVHLLDPQEADAGNDLDHNLVIFLNGAWHDWGVDEWTLNPPYKIIQRGGVAFMWPEVEC
jgi:hypothetical protein